MMATQERIERLAAAKLALEEYCSWSNVWAYLSADGGATPCSRYGADGRECAVYALAGCLMFADGTGEEITPEIADVYMSAAVNNSDDLEEFLEGGQDYTWTLEAEIIAGGF